MPAGSFSLIGISGGGLDVFEQILSAYPDDKPSRRLKALCEEYLADPLSVTIDFDVTKMTEK
jgi:hypothetical protein